MNYATKEHARTATTSIKALSRVFHPEKFATFGKPAYSEVVGYL